MKNIIIAVAITLTSLTTVAHAAGKYDDLVGETPLSKEACTVVAAKYKTNPFLLSELDIAIFKQCLNNSATDAMNRQYAAEAARNAANKNVVSVPVLKDAE